MPMQRCSGTGRFADDADGLASDFIEAIDHRFHNRQVDLSLGPATNSKKVA